ncbi:penicillin-binding protein activator [Arenimonas composti]|uniref:LppC family lipoprotein n=1 Tax=Arenimonas composti TR7-09 = DSM 18010 TaxID=1121013 RepID=A0A091BF08_9GAMM|nr:penicillin-binding protein activator [Arenimonas composti]KFN51293.1 hypothetical protein P873_03230 [Arenimonas composti TR7-09 = DSM 18010]
MSRFAPLLLVLALAGCASVSVQRAPVVVEPDAARKYAAAGDHAQAARAWSETALAARGAARDHAWLRAAEQYWLAGETGAARAAWAETSRRRLDAGDLALHAFLEAAFLSADGDDARALGLLSRPGAEVPANLRVRWLGLRADIAERAGRPFDAAADLAVLADGAERSQRGELLRRIDRLLAGLNDDALAAGAAALPAGHPLYPQAARQLQRRGLPLPRPLERGTGLALDDAVPPAAADGYRPPLRIAVLLPLSGPLAAAGSSVRDGILAAYYGENRRRPEIRFHDTGGNVAGLQGALIRAREEGAQLLVGPLTRDEVDALFGMADLDLPVLALNRGQLPPPPGSATFALTPEEEGAAAAERLLDRGLRRVLVVTQADDNARRALGAFRERLRERGGEIVGEAVVAETEPDFIPTLQAAMGANRPDALFLALRAAPARLLASQMETAGLSGVPKVATSLIQAGGNLRLDTELDGIEFPELPWLIGRSAIGLPDADTIGNTLPSARGGGARLFAFGADAWRLAAWLDHLLAQPGASVQGATGELQLDPLGVVQRVPAWAVFSGGRARPALDGALLPAPVEASD